MRGLHNWTYKNVTAFLKENGFDFFEQLPGSHERWLKLADGSDPERRVEINAIKGGESYPPKTLKTMIYQSGIDQKEWIEWGSS